MLKDFALELEIERDVLHDIIVLAAPSDNPEKFAIIDQVKKLYNPKHKTSTEKLIEGYKKEFGSNKSKRMTVRTVIENKKKINELIAKMPTK